MEEQTIIVRYVRSTKNKHVYSDGEQGVLGAIYMPKEMVGEDPPVALRITIVELTA